MRAKATSARNDRSESSERDSYPLRMATGQLDLFGKGMLFGPDFLRDHVGQIMSDARVALIELVANAYDAGATRVHIEWPDTYGDRFSISDNGTGMTAQEFDTRWRTLGYNRMREQGPNAVFPPNARKVKKRFAFGQSGKGRHGAFCFGNAYEIETWKDGTCLAVKVSLTEGGGEPFRFDQRSERSKKGHGTKIMAVIERNLVSRSSVSSAIGSKFLVDPTFSLLINNKSLNLLSLDSVEQHVCEVPEHGEVQILHIDPRASDRTTHLRGITWWVNGRLVGTPSWNGLDEHGAILDGRSSEAKRFSFVVMANILKPDVKQDWMGFHASARVNAVQQLVREHVIKALDRTLSRSRKDRKREALAETAGALGGLSTVAKKTVGEFAEAIVERCPRIAQGDLARAVTIFANMEKTRTGYGLLAELASCSPDDIDRWTAIMQRWTATEAEAVLNELHWRLELIAKLETLIHREEADELHDLQPLFERGLWMFGPQYESVDFRSNRSLATVVRDLLGGTAEMLPKKRPDFVALPDRSIGVYSADAYDADGEVDGIDSVLVVELKRGGFCLTRKEISQPEDYVVKLRKGNHVGGSTKFSVFILGTSLADDAADDRTIGTYATIRPLQYDRLLKRAHARTFHLLDKVRASFPEIEPDKEVESVLAEHGTPLFESKPDAPVDGTQAVMTSDDGGSGER